MIHISHIIIGERVTQSGEDSTDREKPAWEEHDEAQLLMTGFHSRQKV